MTKTIILQSKNVLAGYKRENDGTIVITNGNDIIASNDEKLIDTKVQEDSIINEIRQSVKSRTVCNHFETVSNNILQVLIRDEIIIFTCMQKTGIL